MTPADLARVHAAAFTEVRSWSEAEFADLLAQPGILLTVTGPAFVVGRITLDEAEVLTLACDPAAQRQGHAATALAAFEDAVLCRGAGQVYLEVAADNTPALALYAKAGYVQTGRRRDYYRTISGQRVDALILSKALARG
jgi:[ribosomal protein S18]-alanine N-acetyltransferase